MPHPWELTDEEAAAEALRMKERRLEADKKAAGLFCQQGAEPKRLSDLSPEELAAEAAELEEENREIDEHDSWLLAQQMAILDLQEADLSDEEIEDLLIKNDGCLTD